MNGVPRIVSSSTAAIRARASAFDGAVAREVPRKIVIRKRVGRPRLGAEGRFDLLDARAKRARLPRREQKTEVERLLQLVGTKIVRERARVARPHFTDHHAIAIAVEHAPKAANDVVHLGLVGAVALFVCEPLELRKLLSRGDFGIVAKLRVLDHLRDHIDAKSIDAAIEPEANHVVHRLDDLGIAKVEVGLLAQKRMQVPFAARRVELPRRAAEGALPVVRRTAISPGLPDVPIALRIAARGSRLEEPCDAGPRYDSAPGRARCGCRADAPPQSADRSSRACRGPDARRSSR